MKSPELLVHAPADGQDSRRRLHGLMDVGTEIVGGAIGPAFSAKVTERPASDGDYVRRVEVKTDENRERPDDRNAGRRDSP